MSNVYLDDSILTGIANAIRAKNGGNNTITPANMATEISNLSSDGPSYVIDYVYAATTANSYTFPIADYITDMDKVLALVVLDKSSSSLKNAYIYRGQKVTGATVKGNTNQTVYILDAISEGYAYRISNDMGIWINNNNNNVSTVYYKNASDGWQGTGAVSGSSDHFYIIQEDT